MLKQFIDLTPRDFADHPVWLACHVADYDEPWYEDTDEETFRPYLGPLPVEPSNEFLVSADAHLDDGSMATGFLTPSSQPRDLGASQPHVFVENLAFGFWWGMLDVPDAHVREFFERIARTPEDVFPITFRVNDSFVVGGVEVVVAGWARLDPG